MEDLPENPLSQSRNYLRARPICLETQKHKTQRRRSRQCLHEQDLLVGGGTSVEPGDDDTAQEEGLELLAHERIWVSGSPEKACGQEAVVETLVGSHSLGLSGKRGRQVEGLLSAGSGPEEHLEGHDVDVFQSHQAGTCECEKAHCEGMEGRRLWLFGVVSELIAAGGERMGW